MIPQRSTASTAQDRTEEERQEQKQAGDENRGWTRGIKGRGVSGGCASWFALAHSGPEPTMAVYASAVSATTNERNR